MSSTYVQSRTYCLRVVLAIFTIIVVVAVAVVAIVGICNSTNAGAVQRYCVRYQVKVYGVGTKTFIPCLPNGNIFFNREDAEEAGKDYVRLFQLNGQYEYQVVELAPGEEPHIQ